jgi:hypothetical protein
MGWCAAWCACRTTRPMPARCSAAPRCASSLRWPLGWEQTVSGPTCPSSCGPCIASQSQVRAGALLLLGLLLRMRAGWWQLAA